MKKFILAIPFILAMAMPAMAQKVSEKEVIDSSITLNNVACSSFTATLVDSTSTVVALLNRTFVAFQNFDTTYQICIGFSNTMSCTNKALIVPENYGLVTIPLAMYKIGGAAPNLKTLNIWCRTNSTVGSSTMSFVQGF